MNCDRLLLFHFSRPRPASHVFFSQIHPGRLLVSTKVYLEGYVHRQVARQCPPFNMWDRQIDMRRRELRKEILIIRKPRTGLMNYRNLEGHLQRHGSFMKPLKTAPQTLQIATWHKSERSDAPAQIPRPYLSRTCIRLVPQLN